MKDEAWPPPINAESAEVEEARKPIQDRAKPKLSTKVLIDIAVTFAIVFLVPLLDWYIFGWYHVYVR